MKQSKQYGSTLSIKAAACAIAFAAMYGAGAGAQEVGVPAEMLPASLNGAPLATIERAFWSCDYIGTTRGVQYAPVDVCVAVTEELKMRKFGGDVEAMFEWWAENKPAAHERMASFELEAAPQP
jgi:hypothetical protein